MAKNDRERYLDEVHSLPPDATIRVKKKKRVMRNSKGDNPPKRVLSPYVIFVRQERPKMVQKGVSQFNEIMRELGQRWRKMSDEEKEPYMKMSEQDRYRYKHQVEEYLK